MLVESYVVRHEDQKTEVEKVISEVYQDIGIELKAAGSDVIEATSIKTVKIMNESLSMSVALPKLIKRDVENWFAMSTVDGLLINDYMKKLETSTVDRIVKQARQSMIEGHGAAKSARL